MQREVETAKSRFLENLTFSHFWEGECGQFPKGFTEYVQKKTIGILAENVAMVLIKVLPNTI